MTFTKENQFPVEFTITDYDDIVIEPDYINEITFTCRSKPYEKEPILIEKKKSTGDIVFDVDKWIFWIHADDTKDLNYGTYGYDIEVKAGEVIQTITGELTITDEYTYGGDN